MDKQARKARESVKNMNFSDKLKYFWDYYKIHTICCIVAVVLAIGTIYSVATREKYDLEVVYFGSRAFDEGRINRFKSELEGVLKDANGDGKVKVNFIVNTVDTSENSQFLLAMQQKCMADLAAATYHSYIVDETFFDIINQDEILEAYFNIENSSLLKDILEPVGRRPNEYWCTRAVYNSEMKKDNEKEKIITENARAAHVYFESAIWN